MNDEQVALARRAMACRGWRWMPGMRWCEQTSLGLSKQRLLDHEIDGFPAYYGCLPDLTDPATMGCLLALVRETRGNPTGFVVPKRDGNWMYYTQLFRADYWTGGSEAEALVAALEAVPSSVKSTST